MKHQYVKFEEFDKKVRKKVQIMLNYMKEVLSSGREDTFTYLLQWFSHMIKGQKMIQFYISSQNRDLVNQPFLSLYANMS